MSTTQTTQVPYPQPIRCSMLAWQSMPRSDAHNATAFIIGVGPQVRNTVFRLSSRGAVSSASMRSSSVTTLPSVSSMLRVSTYRETNASAKCASR